MVVSRPPPRRRRLDRSLVRIAGSLLEPRVGLSPDRQRGDGAGLQIELAVAEMDRVRFPIAEERADTPLRLPIGVRSEDNGQGVTRRYIAWMGHSANAT